MQCIVVHFCKYCFVGCIMQGATLVVALGIACVMKKKAHPMAKFGDVRRRYPDKKAGFARTWALTEAHTESSKKRISWTVKQASTQTPGCD